MRKPRLDLARILTVALAGCCAATWAASQAVGGVVLNEAGDPVPGGDPWEDRTVA